MSLQHLSLLFYCDGGACRHAMREMLMNGREEVYSKISNCVASVHGAKFLVSEMCTVLLVYSTVPYCVQYCAPYQC